MTEHKSGFVSIIGRPNVGKSTFMNRVIGHKIAIMSDKAQTTRNKIQGVMTREDAQIIFLDTPGIHKPKHKLGDYMMRVAKNTLSEIDAIMFMVNVNEDIGRGDEYIMEMLKNVKTPVFLVLNKIDLVHPDALMPKIEKYKTYMDFTEIVPISALEGLNVDHFIDVLKAFNEDEETKAVVMIGEIGGTAEEEAAEWVKANMTKPVVGFVGGQTAPPGKRMGHAGAIISGGKGTAAEKIKTLNECGVKTEDTPSEIGTTLIEAAKEAGMYEELLTVK